METYYFFQLDSYGKITSRDEHDCRNDSDALETARTQLDGHDIEVWLGANRIGAVNRRSHMPEGEELIKLRRPLTLA